MQEGHFSRARCQTHLILRPLGCMCICLLFSIAASARESSNSIIRICVDFAYFGSGHKLAQEIQLSTSDKLAGTLQFACYRYTTPTDSLCIYSQKDLRFKTTKGPKQFPSSLDPVAPAVSYIRSSIIFFAPVELCRQGPIACMLQL